MDAKPSRMSYAKQVASKKRISEPRMNTDVHGWPEHRHLACGARASSPAQLEL